MHSRAISVPMPKAGVPEMAEVCVCMYVCMYMHCVLKIYKIFSVYNSVFMCIHTLIHLHILTSIKLIDTYIHIGHGPSPSKNGGLSKFLTSGIKEKLAGMLHTCKHTYNPNKHTYTYINTYINTYIHYIYYWYIGVPFASEGMLLHGSYGRSTVLFDSHEGQVRSSRNLHAEGQVGTNRSSVLVSTSAPNWIGTVQNKVNYLAEERDREGRSGGGGGSSGTTGGTTVVGLGQGSGKSKKPSEYQRPSSKSISIISSSSTSTVSTPAIGTKVYHTNIYTHINTCIHTYIHVHTYIHTYLNLSKYPALIEPVPYWTFTH